MACVTPFRQLLLPLPSPHLANLPLDLFKGGFLCVYTVTTFKVRLEVSEVADRSGEPDDVEIAKCLKECGNVRNPGITVGVRGSIWRDKMKAA